jgi:hypothetical protein
MASALIVHRRAADLMIGPRCSDALAIQYTRYDDLTGEERDAVELA